MKMALSSQQRQWLVIAVMFLLVSALMVAGYPIWAMVLTWLAIFFASRFTPFQETAVLVSMARDEGNRVQIARSFLWVSARRREALLERGTPSERAVFVAWQQKLLILFIVSTVALLCLSDGLLRPEPVRPAPAPSLPPAVSGAGTVRSIQLHDTTFSTATTVTTDAGVYQVRGAVSAAVGDTVQLKTTPADPANMRQELRELCLNSRVKAACYRLL